MDKEKDNMTPENESNDKYLDNLDLYDDLPKEVVELLMKTHPLLSSEDADKAVEKYHTRYGKRSEINAIREETAKKESELANQNTGYIPKRAKKNQDENLTEENGNNEIQKGNTIVQGFDEYGEDLVKAVRYKSADFRKTGRIPAIDAVPEKKAKSEKELQKEVEDKFGTTAAIDENFKVTRKERPTRKKEEEPRRKTSMDMDMEEFSKNKMLDEFFEDEAEDDDEKLRFPGGKNGGLIFLCVGIVLLGFLAFRTVTLSGRLEKAEAQTAELEETKQQNEELKLENITLKEELDTLQNPADTGDIPETEGENTPDEGAETPTENTDTTQYDTYTVKEGDRIWNISEEVYGNGAYYDRILEANGLTESSVLNIGQVLKIPKVE